ncbi:sulfatase [Reichenbachiella versicolor]|uniref:sulfatase n=1 Tax=Reichenbachiella versicolor TaxID=1821036 RepID=UPI000D6E1A56|nr:sulfatase [Reichenbachiella versicolor]
MKHTILLIVLSVFLTNQSFAQKNNILFISIDDLRTQLGAYGEEQMITPNLDALAKESRLFNRHYVQVPTCGPSRACMLTGKNLTAVSDISHGHLAKQLKGKPETDNPETFIHHLKRNGYYTVGMGKISHQASGHRGKELELPHSWDKFVFDPNNPWKGALLHSYANGVHRNKEYRPAYEFKEVTDEEYSDGYLASLAVNELDQLAGKDQPFFMAVGFFKPHLPFGGPKKYWDMYNHGDIELSPNPEVPQDVDRVFLHPSNEFFGQYTHPEKGGFGVRISDEYAKNVIHANYASVTYTDAQVGKILNKLKELGLDQNTIVIVWGDHGWHLGDQTIWGKHSAFERALNSTFMIKIPGMKKAGVPTDALVASIDVYPTICELAGVEKPQGLDGKSMVSLLKNPKSKGKEAVHSYWRNIISIRSDQYRMAWFYNGEREEVMLFDHKADPNETINIAKQNPKVVEELKEQIRKLNKGFLPL